MSHREAEISINGHHLTEGQAMTVRVALESFSMDVGKQEQPIDTLYLARIEEIRRFLYAPAPSAPLIPQSRAEEMVAEEREQCAQIAEALLHHVNDTPDGDRLNEVARYSNGTVRRIVERIRARKTEASRG